MSTNSVKSHLESEAEDSFRTRQSAQRVYTVEGGQGGAVNESCRPRRPRSRQGDDSVSVRQLGIKASMRTDGQAGQDLSLGPVTVTRTLARKWLGSVQHEQLFIPKPGLPRGNS